MIRAALVGDYRAEYLFVLRKCQARWRQLNEAVLECDAEIALRTAAIRTVQELLGHKDVATTQIYTHVMAKPGIGVRSPLDG